MESTNTYKLGNVIATRELEFNNDGLKKKILIEIGKPRKVKQAGSDHYCPFKITGIGKESVQVAHGADSVQAIALALKIIGSIIDYYERLYPNKITWNNCSWLGFSSTGDLEKTTDEKANDL